MRYLGKSALALSALAITLLVGSPLHAEENHSHKHSCVEQTQKASSNGQAHEAKGDKAKVGCDHHGKAKADGKPCADHAGCKHGANAKAGDKTCADDSCCKDGAACCEGDGKTCAEHEEAPAR